MHIEMFTLDDLDDFARHMRAHAAESGRDGEPIYMPFGRDSPLDADRLRERRQSRWSVEVGRPNWARGWGLYDEGELIGHAELNGGKLPSELHRSLLGMGLDPAHRGRGHGKILLEAVLAWAREQPFLHWVDLGVFAHNERARRLYTSQGFREVGTITDRFRVDGQQIDDVSMTLYVGD